MIHELLLLDGKAPMRFQWDGQSVAAWDGSAARPAGKDRDGFPVDAHVPSEITTADVELAHDQVTWAFRRFELEVGGGSPSRVYAAPFVESLRPRCAGPTHHGEVSQWSSSPPGARGCRVESRYCRCFLLAGDCHVPSPLETSWTLLDNWMAQYEASGWWCGVRGGTQLAAV